MEKNVLIDKSEDYKAGYHDGYVKGYSDKKSLVTKAKKEAESKYEEQLKNLEVHTMYPFNIIYDILDDKVDNTFYLSPELVLKAFSEVLTYREEDILVSRYRDGLTLEECAHKYNVTRERIRQIENKALGKLSHPTVLNSMRAVSYREFKTLQDRCKILENEHSYSELPKEVQRNINRESTKKMFIEDLDLTVRTYNCLRRSGCMTVGDVVSKSSDELMHIRNMGPNSFRELKKKLIELDIWDEVNSNDKVAVA